MAGTKGIDDTNQGAVRRPARDIRMHDVHQTGRLARRARGEALGSGGFDISERTQQDAVAAGGWTPCPTVYTLPLTRRAEATPGSHGVNLWSRDAGPDLAGAFPPAGAAEQRREAIQRQSTDPMAARLGVGSVGRASGSVRQAQPGSEAIADLVLRMMMRDLVLERERRG